MKPTVYIETTIIGHLVARLPRDPVVAGQMLTTRKWWDDARPRFDLFASQVVLDEASRGDKEAATERLEAIADVALVPISNSVWELAERLLEASAMPAKARIDAVHVAIAATNALQYLLTWNCRHLANATLRSKIEQTCRDHGFQPPIICTPIELEEVST